MTETFKRRAGGIRCKLVSLRAPGLGEVLGPGQGESLHRNAPVRCLLGACTEQLVTVHIQDSSGSCCACSFALASGLGIAARSLTFGFSFGVSEKHLTGKPVAACWCDVTADVCMPMPARCLWPYLSGPPLGVVVRFPGVLGVPLGLPVFHRFICNLPGPCSSPTSFVIRVEPIPYRDVLVETPGLPPLRVASQLLQRRSSQDALPLSGPLSGWNVQAHLPFSSQHGQCDFSWAYAQDLLSRWLLGLAAQWSIFIRTSLLFILLSTAHLFVRTCPIRKGHPTRNRANVSVRKCLRGAPVIWALLAVAHLLPVAAAGKSSGLGIEHQVSSPTDAATRPSSHTSVPSHGPDTTPARYPHQPGRPPDVSASTFTDSRGCQAEDFRFLICLYEFQKPAIFLSAWCSEARHEDELVALVLEEQVGGAGSKVIVPVSPQPRSNAVAFIASEVWNLALLRCPVLIQVYAGPFYSFVEYFDGGVTEQDVRLSVGALWPPGGKIFVGDSLAPLRDDGLFQPTPGLLIRVSPPSLIPGIAVPLSRRLSSPREWLHDVDLHGYPRARSSAGKICVLGVWSDQQVCHVDGSTTASDLRARIVEQCGFSHSHATFCTPCEHVAEFATRDIPVRSVIGIVPQALEACRGVFVDARCLACKLQFVLLPPVQTSLNKLLHLVGAVRPVEWELCLHGAPGYDPLTEFFVPTHSSLLVISVHSGRRL